MILKRHSDLYFAACAKVADGGGIYHYKTENGVSVLTEKYPLDRPMYLSISHSPCENVPDRMYVLLREPFAGSTDSGLFSFGISAEGSLLNPTEPVSTKGRCACHLSLSSGRVYAVNYLSGSVVAYSQSEIDSLSGLGADLRARICEAAAITDTHEGKGSHPTRQEAPHTHFVRESPDGKYIFAVDLGVDKIFVYDKLLNVVSTASVPAGEGCRHLDYSPDGRFVYCANELGSSVTVFAYHNGELERLETYAALPADYVGQSTAAAIRVSSDGRIVYVSHRGHDSICAFDVACGGAVLTNPKWTKISGVSPRDFLEVDGFIYVTNEKTNNVTVFSVDSENGKKLTKLDCEFAMPNPLCVVSR